MIGATLMAAVGSGGVVVIAGRAARGRLAPTHRHVVGIPEAPIGSSDAATRPRSVRHRRAPMVRHVVLGSCLLVTAVTFGPPATLVAVGLTLFWGRLQPISTARRRRQRIERDLPPTMDLLVLGVRAGLSPRQAVVELATSTLGPVGDALSHVVHRIERGQPFADALGALAQELGPPATGLVDVIVTSDRNGLPLGPMLDQLGLEARAARRRLDQTAARKLPVRLSFPLVVCTLPSFVLLAIVPAVIAALSSLGGSAW